MWVQPEHCTSARVLTRRSMFFICSSSCSVISSTMGLSFPVWIHHKNHSFHEWGFLAANHPSALASQNITTNMLWPIRTSQLIICVKSPESLTGYQCSFPHKLKHSNREKDWLILNKTFKWCHMANICWWWDNISTAVQWDKLQSFKCWIRLRSVCVPSVNTVVIGDQTERHCSPPNTSTNNTDTDFH